MKLTTVSVKNYRSYVANNGDRKGPVLSLGSGLNLLVGPNNCGKSNLLRAIALALDPLDCQRFDPECDTPIQVHRDLPSISLHFKCDPWIGVEKTLLSLLGDYEKSAGAERTFAEESELQFRVSYTNTAGLSPAGSQNCRLLHLGGTLIHPPNGNGPKPPSSSRRDQQQRALTAENVPERHADKTSYRF